MAGGLARPRRLVAPLPNARGLGTFTARVADLGDLFHRVRVPLLALVCLLEALVSPAATNLSRPRLPVDYSIRHWSGKEGITIRSVEAILQTRDGFLWFGMNSGLGRFNGASFQVFDPANTPALGVSYVTALAEDQDGTLWIGTAGGGITHYSYGVFERFSATNGLANEQVKCLHVARDGRLWIGTDGGGVFVRDPKTGSFLSYGDAAGLSEPFVIGITENDRGELLFVTYKDGPFRLVNNRFEPVRLSPPHSGGAGFSLTRSLQGRVWLGTPSGVYRLENDVFHLWTPAEQIPGHDPVVAWEFAENDIWLGTAQGLVHWENGNWTAYPIGGGSSGRFASAFVRDREGSIWKSAEGTGVVQLRRTKFVTFGVQEGMSDEVITTVSSTRDGALWVGTPRGLHRFREGRLDTFSKDHGLPDTFIFSVGEDTHGALWVATRLGGLAVFDGERFHPVPREHQLPVRAAWCVTPTRDGSVWVGTSRGAFQYRDRRRVDHIHGKERLPNDDVRSIAEDSEGGLWFGTSYGLNRLKDGQMDTFNAVSNLPPMEVVIALQPDTDGSLWIGTMSRGLFLCRSNLFYHFGSAAGLQADSITSITLEGTNALWLGTTRGVQRVTRASLDARVNGSSRPIDFQVFTRREGLGSDECSGTIQPTATMDSDGRIWIATTSGLSTLHPSRIPRNQTLPLPHIDRVAVEGPNLIPTLGGRTLEGGTSQLAAINPLSTDWGDTPAPAAQRRSVFNVIGLDTVWIPPGQDRLEIQYSGLSFVLPEAVTFLYQLQGYDSDWVNAGGRGVAYYTRVPPGRYLFQVRARNEDGSTSQPTTITVLVAPAWWQTTWFRVVAGLVLAGLVFSLFAMRVRSIERKQRASSELSRHLIRSQEQERCRLAGELHDGIGQELQLIRNRSELTQQRMTPSEDVVRELQAISTTAARAIQGVRLLSRGLRPPELDQLGLTQALRWLVTNASEASSARLESRVEAVDGYLPHEQELDFYRVAQEALNNAMKHGQASEITLEVERSSTGLSLSIFDNGCGFDHDLVNSSPTRGSGLKTMRERAAMLGGTLDIRSQIRSGTRLTLEVPLGNLPARPPANPRPT